MKKIMHWFVKYIVVKQRYTGALIILAFWSIGKYHAISRSLFVLYTLLENKKINLTFYLTVGVLILIVWNTLPGSSGCKVISIMPANLHQSNGIQIINGYVDKLSRYISLLLVARLVYICRLSINLSKKTKLT